MAMKSQQIRDILERQSLTIGFTILDQDRTPVPKAAITSLKLTLYDLSDDTHPILNGRDQQDILDANNVTMDATLGIITWAVQPDDNPIVDDTLDIENHVGLFQMEWVGGGSYAHEVVFKVRNLIRRPS